MNIRVKKMIDKSHIVLEVIDIRVPNETKSKMLERYLLKMGKPFIRVFNKADLVPKDFAKQVVDKMSGVYVSSKKKKGIRDLRRKIKKTLGGRKKAVISVIGYPNTGKSSLINALKGRKSAGVAPIPGHTRGEQLIRMDKNIMLIDTPGAITSESKNVLASKGAIAPEKIKDPERAASILLEKILKHNPGSVKSFYGVEEESSRQIMNQLCKKRGWKRPERAAKKILQDWNSGKLRGFWH